MSRGPSRPTTPADRARAVALYVETGDAHAVAARTGLTAKRVRELAKIASREAR